MQGRFTDTWEAALTAETAARERKAQERSYRRMLAMTDALLGRLEVLNLRGQDRLSRRASRSIARTLEQVSPPARARFPACETVQHAVDGVFEVQDELLYRLRQTVHSQHPEAWDSDLEDDAPVEARRTA